MQTLWSRVAQVRGACRCPQCVPSVHAVSRRATASATRRIPRYLTSSTLWYSGIFAVAATFDAGFKQQRRDKWDKAIAEVKEELAGAGQVTAEDRREEFDVRIAEGVEGDGIRFIPFRGDEEDEESQYADGWTRADWPSNTGAPLHPKHLPLTSIYAEDWQRSDAEMYRWTPKKLAMARTSVDILLLELMHELRKNDNSHLAAESVPVDYVPALCQNLEGLTKQITDKQNRMRILRRADYEMTHYTLPDAPDHKLAIPEDENAMCNYEEDDENRFRATQRDLNSSIRQIFKQYSKERISKPSLLGRIIYNLHTSPAPPNLHTFNTLLLGFSRASDALSFRRVLSSFRRCHMRPNDLTLAVVLNHFAAVDDPERFAYWIELLRGGQNGLSLARPDVRIDNESRKRLIPHPEHPDKIIQLPYATPLVFGAVVAGVLKFTGFEAALQICRSMGQEGWGLCMAGLTPLLHDCVHRGDWASGLAVWRQIQELKARSRRREEGRWVTERIRLDTFAAMLRLCVTCGQREVFGEVWESALKSHRGMEGRLRRLIKDMGNEKEQGANALDRAIDSADRRSRKRDLAIVLDGAAERLDRHRVSIAAEEQAWTQHADPAPGSLKIDEPPRRGVEITPPDATIAPPASRFISDDFRPGAILKAAEQGNVFPRSQSLGLTPPNMMSLINVDRIISDNFRPGAILEAAEQQDVFPRAQSIGHTPLNTMRSLIGIRLVPSDFRAGAILELTEQEEVLPQAQTLASFAEQSQVPRLDEQTKTRPRDDMSYFEFAELTDLDALQKRQGTSAEATTSTVSGEQTSTRDFDAMSGPLQPHSWRMDARAVDEEAVSSTQPRRPLPTFQAPASEREHLPEVTPGVVDSAPPNAWGIEATAKRKEAVTESKSQPPPTPVRARTAWGLETTAEEAARDGSSKPRPPPAPPRTQVRIQKNPTRLARQDCSRNEESSSPPFRLRISKHAALGPKFRRVGFEGESPMGLREEAVAAS